MSGHQRADAELTGGKVANLQQLMSLKYPVPAGICITTQTYLDFLEHNGLSSAVFDLLTRVDTSGFELAAISQEIVAMMASGEIPEQIGSAVADSVEELTAGSCRRLIARSSATSEDLLGATSAGVYLSLPNVDPIDIVLAVKQVWTSLHSISAFYYRRKYGIPSATAKMAVLLQPMVTADMFGVFFSRDPVRDFGCIVEWQLTSGSTHGNMFDAVTDGHSPIGTLRLSGPACFADQVKLPCINSLLDLGRNLESELGGPVDVEWAAIGEAVTLLQVRIVANNLHTVKTLAISDVDSRDETAINLRGCTDLDTRWRQKHTSMRELARDFGIDRTRCFYVEYGDNTAASSAQTQLKGQVRTRYVFMDISEELRSIIVPIHEISDNLTKLLGNDRAATVRIRECFTEQHSLLSGISQGSNDVLVEHVRGGIKGLIRGLSSVRRFSVDHNDNISGYHQNSEDRDHYEFDRESRSFRRYDALSRDDSSGSRSESDELDTLNEALTTVASFTRTATNAFGAVRLEWCVLDGKPYLLDFSLENSMRDGGPPSSHNTISPGTATGTVLILPDIGDLEYLSDGNLISVGSVDPAVLEHDAVQKLIAFVSAESQIHPIVVVAKRPLTALAPIIDCASGFIFDDGSHLGHLSILLRERGKPAVLVRDSTENLTSGDHVEIGPFGLRHIEPVEG
jgi:hypothetical protein